MTTGWRDLGVCDKVVLAVGKVTSAARLTEPWHTIDTPPPAIISPEKIVLVDWFH